MDVFSYHQSRCLIGNSSEHELFAEIATWQLHLVTIKNARAANQVEGKTSTFLECALR